MAKEGSFVIHLWCHVELSDESEDDFVMPPKLLVLPLNATERGLESWTVDCTCGAKDDDGERMFACDTCGVWQHTRCAGIHSSDEIPAKKAKTPINQPRQLTRVFLSPTQLAEQRQPQMMVPA
ncbi:hypothetical protein DVH24_009551 [Malus domestica]|uniref:PHD-type domain-containing protein n=1 Tax=Malus domestica TaxID=3750 RepID=A0A498IR41_MALDO|nr:hypothetical protein DVH24_009551 [Malus domestica]